MAARPRDHKHGGFGKATKARSPAWRLSANRALHVQGIPPMGLGPKTAACRMRKCRPESQSNTNSRKGVLGGVFGRSAHLLGIEVVEVQVHTKVCHLHTYDKKPR